MTFGKRDLRSGSFDSGGGLRWGDPRPAAHVARRTCDERPEALGSASVRQQRSSGACFGEIWSSWQCAARQILLHGSGDALAIQERGPPASPQHDVCFSLSLSLSLLLAHDALALRLQCPHPPRPPLRRDISCSVARVHAVVGWLMLSIDHRVSFGQWRFPFLTQWQRSLPVC